MKDLLHYILTHIVDNPDAVVIDETVAEDESVTLKVTVNDADIGKVIGKEGRVIKAIRSIVRIAAIRANKRVYITLNDDNEAGHTEE